MDACCNKLAQRARERVCAWTSTGARATLDDQMDDGDGRPEDGGGQSFGALLRAYRGWRDLTQEQLADRSGISVQAVSMLERGVRRAPRAATVDALARALELDAARREALLTAAREGPAPRSAAPEPPPLPARRRRSRRVSVALASMLALLVAGALFAVLPGALGARHVPRLPGDSSSPTVSSSGLTPPASAVVYFAGSDRTLLRRIGYDGIGVAGSWSTTPGPVLSTQVPIQQIVGVSPDGHYAVRLDAHRQNWEILDADDQVISTVLTTMDSTGLGTWANDSRHLCRMGIVDPLQWQVTVTDALVPGSQVVAVPVRSLTDPPAVTIAACDVAADRAVLVEPLTEFLPAPPSAQRIAVLVDLSDGSIVTRVPIGDSTHGVVFSPDCRYLATIDYERGTSSVVSLLTGKTVRVEKGEVRGFSADGTRVVENSRFEPLLVELGTTRVVDWRSSRVVYSKDGWTSTVRAQPGGQALAMGVLREIPTGTHEAPSDLVIVPAEGTSTVLPNATVY